MNTRTCGRRLFVTLLALFATSAGNAWAADPLDIAVIGSSGMIGERVVNEALARGHHVTAIARDPAKVTVSHDRLTVAKGDVFDADAIARIAAGSTRGTHRYVSRRRRCAAHE